MRLTNTRNGLTAFAAILILTFIHLSATAQITTETISPIDGGDSMQMTLPEIPQPGITITLTNGNQFFISITNAASVANYELYHRPALDSAHPWQLGQVGAQGQSNFVAGMSYDYEFFRIFVGSDWDGDGVLNQSDADPLDANVGLLSVTIETPATGSVVQ